MAKLIGVKPIDMVNGDITKIEYNGEVYEKVGTDSPQVGDIGMIIDAWGGLIDGDYYEVTDVKNNDGRTYPGLGDGIYGCVEDKDTMFFRKADSLLDGLTELEYPEVGGAVRFTKDGLDYVSGKLYSIVEVDVESEEFAIIDDADDPNFFDFTFPEIDGFFKLQEVETAVKAGDIIEMTTDDCWRDFRKGDQFEVKGDSEEPTHLYIIDNNGDRRYILKYDHLKFKVVKAAEEAPAEELFAKVNRPNNEPIVGDFVEFGLSDYDKHYFKVGKKYEVDEDKDVIDEEGHVLPLYNSNRPIKSIFVKYTQEQAEQVAEVGDKILIVDEDVITHGYSNGDVVEVMDEFRSGDVKGDGTCIIFPREYIVLTDAQVGGKTDQTTPKVGDYVVALSDNPYFITVPEAGALRVTDVDTKINVIRVELQHDFGNGEAGEEFNVERRYFRLATQEEIAETLGISEVDLEVAEAKRQFKRHFKGSKIEVGDLVKVVISPNALPTGSYFIVKSVDSEGYLRSTLNNGKLTRGGYRYKPERVELIAKAADVYV